MVVHCHHSCRIDRAVLMASIDLGQRSVLFGIYRYNSLSRFNDASFFKQAQEGQKRNWRVVALRHQYDQLLWFAPLGVDQHTEDDIAKTIQHVWQLGIE